MLKRSRTVETRDRNGCVQLCRAGPAPTEALVAEGGGVERAAALRFLVLLHMRRAIT